MTINSKNLLLYLLLILGGSVLGFLAGGYISSNFGMGLFSTVRSARTLGTCNPSSAHCGHCAPVNFPSRSKPSRLALTTS